MQPQSIRTRAGLPLLVPHVAKLLGVPERTIRWWAATGRLRGRRLRIKVWAFAELDVLEFARRHFDSRDSGEANGSGEAGAA